MKSVGLICEYNPFHNGHIYHINKVKEMFPEHTIIVVMSGNVTQRGDFSIIDKWSKTEIALNYADLVVELPFVFSTQSADVFAKGAVTILKELNVEAIIFGSECGNTEDLIEMAKIQKQKKYNSLVKSYLNEGINYPTAMSKAIYDLGKMKISSPNDLLGLSYIKEIINTNIKPITIKRTTDFHSNSLKGKVISATAIRNAIKEKKNIKKFVPKETLPFLKKTKFTDDYFKLLKYKIISSNIKDYLDVDEGIENRIYSVIDKCNSLEELINKIKNKRFTYNKIKRMLMHILIGFTKEEAKKHNKITYIRVLGFNNKGRKYLKEIKSNIPIITSYNENIEMLQIENRVSLIYDNSLDYKHKPIIK